MIPRIMCIAVFVHQGTPVHSAGGSEGRDRGLSESTQKNKPHAPHAQRTRRWAGGALLVFTQSTPALVGLAHGHCAFKTAVDFLEPVTGVVGLIRCPRG